MTRGRPWTVKGERCLKKLFDGGFSLRQVAVKIGKTIESMRQKMFELGLVEQERMKTFCSSSSSVSEPV